SAVENPAYCRTVHGRPGYIVRYGPRKNGGEPGMGGRGSSPRKAADENNGLTGVSSRGGGRGPFSGFAAGGPPVGRGGAPTRARHPGDVLEIRARAHDRTPSSWSSSWSVPRTSHRMKMKRSTPAARYLASLAPGFPARITVRAPAAFSRGAVSSTADSYLLSL